MSQIYRRPLTPLLLDACIVILTYLGRYTVHFSPACQIDCMSYYFIVL